MKESELRKPNIYEISFKVEKIRHCNKKLDVWAASRYGASVLYAKFHAIRRDWTIRKTDIHPCPISRKSSGVAGTRVPSSANRPRAPRVIRPRSYWQAGQKAERLLLFHLCISILSLFLKPNRRNVICLLVRSRKLSLHRGIQIRENGSGWKWMNTHKACPVTRSVVSGGPKTTPTFRDPPEGLTGLSI